MPLRLMLKHPGRYSHPHPALNRAANINRQFPRNAGIPKRSSRQLLVLTAPRSKSKIWIPALRRRLLSGEILRGKLKGFAVSSWRAVKNPEANSIRDTARMF